MYGLIGSIVTVPGRREELARIILEGTRGMPGCLSYVVAKDASHDETLWVTEVWEDRESHEASLSLPRVRDAIGRGRPLIAELGTRIVTTPVGSLGLLEGRA